MTRQHEVLRSAALLEGIELQETIGAGRTATVWRARWRDREVAVKVLAEEWRVRTAQGLSHPGIVEALAQGQLLGREYMVQELFPTDLHRLMGSRPLPPRWRRPILLPLLDALEHAHQLGVVHGDLKPANVLVDPHSRPVRMALTDFGHGVAYAAPELMTSLRSSERGELEEGVSTLPYLAPERLAGEASHPAGDLYSLGVLLFEVLTGRLPLGLELPGDLEAGVDPRLDRLVKALVSRRAAERPSLSQVRQTLLRVLPGRTNQAASPQEEADMVLIPGGFLVIGDRGDPEASPMHEVRYESFWIDRAPVTNLAYEEFVRATGATRPAPWPKGRLPKRLHRLPVTGVSWEDAQRYSNWVGKRLLSEVEWERAAQGPEHRRYPYGEEFQEACLNTDPRHLVAVDSYPGGVSSEGVADLTGNGWEWTASWFAPYGGPASSSGGRARVVRGGFDPRRPLSGSATFRAGLRPDVRDPGVTFRCARDADPH